MFSFSESLDIKAPVERVYKILVDFKNYRKFNPPELKKVTVVSLTENHAEVNYALSSMRITTDCTLDYKLIPNKSLKWKLVDGAVFKHNSGTWDLTSVDKNVTRVALKTKVEFSFFVPSSIFEKQLSESTPKMLSNLVKLAEKRGD